MEAVNNKQQLSKADKKRNEVLNGNLWKVIISVTFPIFLYQFINVLYQIFDQVMVSSIGSSYVSAVAAISQLKALISTFGAGLAAGGSILIAKYYGAYDYKKANQYANTTFMISLILVGVISLMIPFSNGIMELAQIPEDLIKISSVYFAMQLFEQIIIVFNNLFIAMQKARCSTRPIFVTNIASMVVKMALNAILIYGFKVTELWYVELATIISQLVIMIAGVFYMFDKKNDIRYSFDTKAFKLPIVKDVFVYSFPLFLGKFIIFFGKVSINAMCSFYGSLTVGALSVSNNLSGLITNPGAAFEDSESSIVSMNLGNRNMKRTFKTFCISSIYNVIWGIIGFVCVRLLFLDDIVSLFALSNGNDTLEFITAIKDIFFYDCLSIPALIINSVVLGFLYGYGQTFISTINNIFRISIRIISLYILQNFTTLGIQSVGVSMAISNGAIALFAIIMLIIFIIRTKLKGYKGMHLKDPEPRMVYVNGIVVNQDLLDEENKEK